MAVKHVLTVAPLAMAVMYRDTMGVCLGLSFSAFVACDSLIPSLAKLLLAAGMHGADMNKAKQGVLPESLGIAAGTVYLATLFLFFPFPFMHWSRSAGLAEFPIFPFQQLGEYSSALLSICCMLFLGFVDDVMNVKWRHKIVLPAISSLPLLMIYSVTSGVTQVVVPTPLQPILGPLVELGILYYVYMAGLAVFCTHSINILAGVNGVEVGQTLVIACFVVIHDVISIAKHEAVGRHLFSLHLIVPFVSVSLALLKWNWYPARVFVGDTFCYFAGMTFAVVGILGHFSKTLLLFFVPQILNFVYSSPQLFGLIPCPRHRLPRLNPDTGKLEPSAVTIDKARQRLCAAVRFFAAFGLVKVLSETDSALTINNLTLLNWLLNIVGPLKEHHLTVVLLVFQAVCNTVGLFIRHRLSAVLF